MRVNRLNGLALLNIHRDIIKNSEEIVGMYVNKHPRCIPLYSHSYFILKSYFIEVTTLNVLFLLNTCVSVINYDIILKCIS